MTMSESRRAADPSAAAPAAASLKTHLAELSGRLESGHGNALSSYEVAQRSLRFFEAVVVEDDWTHSEQLLRRLRAHGRRLMSAQPSEVVVGNILRRVSKIVRDEVERGTAPEGSAVPSVDTGGSRLGRSGMELITSPTTTKTTTTTTSTLKADIVEAIGELRSELETSIENITSQSLDHVHSDEVILTAGFSNTVLRFLRQAGKKRNVKVIVAEGSPHFRGHEMAAKLSEAGIETTLITDSAVFAIMSRVHKVILGTHGILADGGLQSVAGSKMVALAANHHSVPLIVVASMYKLSPQFFRSYDQESFNQFLSPEKVFPSAQAGSLISSPLHIPVPLFDHVPPDLVTLLISNIGGHAPSYVYRLLSDLYHPDDYELEADGEGVDDVVQDSF